ncbi:MAG: glutamate racemase [Pseudomonadales bacterium]|nr:glutamate racemase [Pseudomonadales bacterium]
MNDGPIGVIDSGVGGLSVWREIARELPHEDTVYFADQAHLPYGSRERDQIRRFVTAITHFLLQRRCKAVVLACNTASAAALKHLRETFPLLPTIGMEPAVKPAAAITKTGVVGIMATPATFQGALFAATAGRHARGVRLINQVCEGLADHIEGGDLTGAATEAMLRGFLEPIMAARADTIVLGCTHYPFVTETIRRIVGPDVTVIDPAPAVARHTRQVLAGQALLTTQIRPGRHQFFSTATCRRFATAAMQLAQVRADTTYVTWLGDSVEVWQAPQSSE